MAKRKKIGVLGLGELGLDAGSVGANAAHTHLSAWGLPPQRESVRMVDGDGSAAAAELVRLLRDEAKVL